MTQGYTFIFKTRYFIATTALKFMYLYLCTYMYLYIELVVNVRFVSAESDRPSEHQQQRSEDSRRSACMYMFSSTLLFIEPLHCTVTPLSCFPSFSLFSLLSSPLLSSPLPTNTAQCDSAWTHRASSHWTRRDRSPPHLWRK